MLMLMLRCYLRHWDREAPEISAALGNTDKSEENASERLHQRLKLSVGDGGGGGGDGGVQERSLRK